MLKKTGFILILIGTIITSCKKDNNTIIKSIDGMNWAKSDINGLAGNIVKSLAIDDKGNKWFGTNKGLSRFDGDKWQTYVRSDSDKYNGINGLSLFKSGKGYEIWMATNQGATVAIFNSEGDITSSTSYLTNSFEIASNVVNNVIVDTNQIKWFMTDAGLSIWGTMWHKKTGDRDIDFSPAICGAFSKTGPNYVGRKSGSMIKFNYSEVDGVTGASEWIYPYNGEIVDTVRYIYVSSKGELWLACLGNSDMNPNIGTLEFPKDGLMRHIGDDPKSLDSRAYFNTATGGLINNRINYITESPDQKIWIGSEGGISYQLNDTAFANYSMKDGLCDKFVNAIAFDKDGSVWVGTNNGVSHLKNGAFINYKAQ